MKWLKQPFMRVFVIGSGLALLILAASSTFLNSPQCPASYTQQQVDASECVIGANIGLGLGIFASGAIEVITVVVTLILLIRSKLKNSH